MPFTHARRRGATVLFRRKIPVDLRDRFGSHEIVRSIGRATPGEARRIVHRLWSQTELVFMRVRSEQGLTRGEIARVVAAAVDAFRDDVEVAIADVIPGMPLSGMDEPVGRADRSRGEAALYGSMLDRSDVVAQAGGASALAREVLAIVREEEVCRRLMSAPGVGPITALAFRATVDRLERFDRSRDVGAHLGLTPSRCRSGEIDIQGRISRCGDELARTALYEAANAPLVCSREASSPRAWGMRIAKHRGMTRARVAVARKLAVVLHRIGVDGTDFRFGPEPATAAA